MNWLTNPHADFVLAAYAIAAIALLGMVAMSLCAYKRRVKEWQALSQNHADDQ